MDGLTISFNFIGKDQMIRAINTLDTSLDDFSNVFEKCADDFYSTMKRVFATEGKELGTPWRPLTESTKAAKESEYPGKGILERTGALKQSLTNRNDTNAICEVGPTSLKIDSQVKTQSGIPLLKLHQYGWNKPEIVPKTASALSWGAGDNKVFAQKSKAVRVDARPVFIMNEDVKERWIRLFQVEIQTKLEGAKSS